MKNSLSRMRYGEMDQEDGLKEKGKTHLKSGGRAR